MGKILGRHALKKAITILKQSGKSIVFTNGCFELLHVGHVRLLRRARSCGDVLVVAVNSDASVRLLKGPTRPLVPVRERAEVLASLDTVDYVTIFPEFTPQRLISQVHPDVLVKGGDWGKDEIVGRESVEAGGGRVIRIPLSHGHSTTRIVQEITALRSRVRI